MNYYGSCSQFSGEKSVGEETMSSFSGNDFQQIHVSNEDLRIPLFNLTKLHQKMDSLQQFLSESIDRNMLLGKDQMDMVSNEISSAINQIIVNGAAMIGGSTQSQIGQGTVLMPENFVDYIDPNASKSSVVDEKVDLISLNASLIRTNQITGKNPVESVDLTVQMPYPTAERSNTLADLLGFGAIKPDFSSNCEKVKGKRDLKDEIDDENCEILELDAVELLAEHIHFCEICGKGFKRDANLRMHMRAHGNQFKTPEALAKPEKLCVGSMRKVRFSCPFLGCNRNKSHKKFRPLKSAVCVKNHFRRSHCPKMYSCNRCNKKSFSVVADLKSHLKHCGESKWRCSCGTTFSRKDKLFGHMALFEGHMPAITEDVEKSNNNGGTITAMEKDDETQIEEQFAVDGFDQGFLFDGLQENFGSIVDEDCFKDVFGSSVLGITGMEGWFDM